MAVNVATLVAKLEADIRDFDRDMRTANRRLDRFENTTKKASKGMGAFGKILAAVSVAVAVRKIAMLGKEMVGLAVDAEEAASAFKTTFGPAVHRAQKFVDEFATKAGFADHELQQLMATTGNIVQGLGATEDASFDLSEQMATLAADVASFSNAAGGAPAVLKALQSALTGEREALKTYGIVVSETDVVERALLMTHKESKDELTKLDKAYATMQIATERAGKAVGDLDRTADSAANTIRRIEARITNLKTAMGAQLLPVLEEVLPILESLVLTLGPKLIKAAGDAGIAVGRLLGIFDPFIKAQTMQLEISRDIEQSMGAGFGAMTKFRTGVERLARTGQLNRTTFKSMREDFGVSLEEAVLGTSIAMRILTEETGWTRGEFAGFGDDIPKLGTVARDLWDQTGDLADIFGDLGIEVETTAKAHQGAAGAARRHEIMTERLKGQSLGLEEAQIRVKKAVDNARDAHTNYARSLRGLGDPVFRALDLFKTWQDTVERLDDGIADTAAEQVELGLATWDVQAAFGALTEAQIESAISGLAAALDITRVAAEKLLVELGLLTGTQWSADFELRVFGDPRFGRSGGGAYEVPRRPGGGGGQTNMPLPTTATDPRFGRAGSYQFGGMVPGPVGRPQLAVVHGGEEIRTPEQQAGTVVNVTQNVHDDFRDPGAARRIVRELARELEDYYQETAR